MRFSGARAWNAILGLGWLVGCSPAAKPDLDDGGKDVVAPLSLPEACDALPSATGDVVRVQDADGLRAAVRDARPGQTILLAAGIYDLSGGDARSNLRITAPRVVMRGEGPDPAAVVLDARIDTGELVTLAADGVTVAQLTLAHAFGSGVAVDGASGAQVYRVRFVDTGESAMVARGRAGAWADTGTVACADFVRAESCSTGLELRQAEGWTIRDSRFDHAGCDAPGLLAWTGSRGTRLTRSRLQSDGIALRVGDADYDEGHERVYADDACPDARTGHFGGVFEDSFVVGSVRVESACGTTVRHLSVAGGDVVTSLVTDARLENNLAAVVDATGSAQQSGNLRPSAQDFLDAAVGDLHLAPGSAARGAGVPLVGDDGLDIDGDTRNLAAPSVGADEG